jgi:hypothetical protein
MSTLEVDSIVASTSGADLNLDGAGSGVVNLATGAKLNGVALTDTFSTPNPNLIINGDMRIAQRGTVTGISNAVAYGGPDRVGIINSNLGAVTVQQTTDAPANTAFVSCHEVDVTTADASPAAADQLATYYSFEGLDLQHLKWGTANAEDLTLQMYVKSNKTGNFVLECYMPDGGGYHTSQLVNIAVADTWELKTITIPGNTSQAPANDNTVGLSFYFWLDSGTDYTSGSLNAGWAAFSAANRAAGITLALGDNTANYFRMTGLKAEVGSTATAFVPDNYGTALAKCQRYYQVAGNVINAQLFMAHCVDPTVADGVCHFPVTMRTSATVSVSSVSHFNVRYGIGVTSSAASAVVGYATSSLSTAFLRVTIPSALTVGQAASVSINSASGQLRFDAEL